VLRGVVIEPISRGWTCAACECVCTLAQEAKAGSPRQTASSKMLDGPGGVIAVRPCAGDDDGQPAPGHQEHDV